MSNTSPASLCQQLSDIFANEIPITSALGLEVRDWQNQQIQLHLPLTANINQHNSMFGGSLYSAAVLAGWGWLYLRLREAGINTTHIVIQAGKIDYPLPILADATVVCAAPNEASWARFFKTYQRHGKARIALTSRILTHDGKDGVRFTGQFVLHD